MALPTTFQQRLSAIAEQTAQLVGDAYQAGIDSTLPTTPPSTGKTAWGLADGLVQDPAIFSPIYTRDGWKYIRAWLTYPSDLDTGTLKKLKAYKAAGVKTIVTVTTGERAVTDPITKKTTYKEVNFGTADAAAAWAKRNRANIEAYIDILSIGNELDANNYRASDMGSNSSWDKYVSLFLKPLHDNLPNTLLASSSVTYGADPTVLPGRVQAQKDAGVFAYAKYADIHPYTSLADIPKYDAVLAQIKAIVGPNVTLIATELGIIVPSGSNMLKTYTTGWPAFKAILEKYFPIAIFYRITKRDANDQRYVYNPDGSNTDTTSLVKP